MFMIRFISKAVKFVAERQAPAVSWQQCRPVLVRSTTREHPWGGNRNPCQAKWPNITMRSSFLTILLLFTALVPPETACAQTTVPPDPEVVILPQEDLNALSEAGIETAKDYQDFIERLERLAYDYQRSFSEVKDHHARKYEGALQRMIFEINEGLYCSDIEALSDDMENLIEDLEEHEDHFRNDVGDPQLYKLSRKLRRELEVFHDELHDEILGRLVEEVARKGIEEYLADERAGIEDARKIYIKTLAARTKLLEEVERAISELEIEKTLHSEEYEELRAELAELAREMADWQLVELDSGLVLVVPQDPQGPIEAPPMPPAPTRGPRDRLIILESGDAAVTREYIDSIDVPSPSLPIFVSSETGDLIVTGWSQAKVLVRFDVEIAAETKQEAKAFTDDIQVKLYSNERGVYLKTHFPSLSDPGRQVGKSRVTVKVPAANMLTAENSFGTVIITGLEAGLKLDANYCDVRIDEVSGRIEAANKMNPLNVTNSRGSISLRNSLAKILVEDCGAEFDIENSYAPVEVRNCSGLAAVRNSGLVFFGDHSGDISIENGNGTVQVTDLRGNLDATSSFKPMYVSDVVGSVTLRNMSGGIEVNSVSGAATVQNKFGNISCRYVGGPLQVSNESGTVAIEIAEALTGASYVNATFSTVSLTLYEESDVLLNAVTQGGVITGTSSKVIYSGDNTRSTKISYGKATTPLEVKAANSTIVIGGKEGI